MSKLKIVSIALLPLFISQPVMANDALTETMFQSGKIYNAIIVAMIVLLGIFFYLVRLDRKVSAMEKEIIKN